MEIKVHQYSEFVEVLFENTNGVTSTGLLDVIEASMFLEQLKDAVEELDRIVYDN